MLATPSPHRLLPYLALLLAVALWGGTTVVGKLSTLEVPVFSLVFLRFCCASLILVPLFLFDRHRPRLTFRDLPCLILLGLLGMTFNIGFFFLGIARASILDTSVMVALTPIFISLGGVLFFAERLHFGAWFGFGLATLGAFIALASGTTSAHHSLLGNLSIAASMFSLVAYTLLSKGVAQRYSAMTIVTISLVVGMISFAPLAAWDVARHADLSGFHDGRLLWGLLYLSLGSSVIAYWCYEWGLEYLPASTVGILSYFQPLVSILLAVLFLGESFTYRYALGLLIAAAGIYLVLERPHLGNIFAKHHLTTRHPVHRS